MSADNYWYCWKEGGTYFAVMRFASDKYRNRITARERTRATTFDSFADLQRFLIDPRNRTEYTRELAFPTRLVEVEEGAAVITDEPRYTLDDYLRRRAVVERLQAENERLRDALNRYGTHESNCQFYEPMFPCRLPISHSCTCGLAEAQE